jgi:hypothetical protein
MNDLVETTQALHEDIVYEDSYYEKLFSTYNDYKMCLDIVVDIYKDYGSVTAPPEYEDLIADIASHNDSIIMELASVEMMQVCPDSDSRYQCWKGKEPWHADSWPEDDDDIECCRSGEFEALCDYASYNYAAYDFDALLIRILQDLGYSVGVGRSYWDTIFGAPMPSHLPDDHIRYFNDAQLVLVSEMDMGSPFQNNTPYQLRLAGLCT